MNREAVLKAAIEATTVQRDKVYGSPDINFERIAKGLDIIFDRPVTKSQVSLVLAMVKLCRLVQSEDHADSWIDLAGYAACGAEVSDAKDQK